MRKFTKLFLTLALLLAGVVNSNATVEKVNLSFTAEFYCNSTWDSSTKLFTWGNKAGREAWMSDDWVFVAVNGFSGDLSEYTKMVFKLEDFTNVAENKLIIYFKENKGNTQSMDWVTSAELVPGVDGYAELDLTTFDWKNVDSSKGTIDKTNIADVTIYGTDRTDATQVGSVKITEAWAEKPEYIYDPTADVDPGVGAIPVGSVSLIKGNGTLSDDVVDSYFTKINAGAPAQSTITADAGRAGGKGIKITSISTASDVWDTQFWIKFDTPLNSGTKLHIEFDYRASEDANVTTQEHSGTFNYVYWAGINGFNPTKKWQHFSQDFTVSTGDESANIVIQSIAFNLNETKDKAIDFFFDNFLVYAEKADFTIGAAGWGTVGFEKAVNFGDDVKAYAAVYNAGSGSVTLTPITCLSANKGAIIEAAAGDYYAITDDTPGFAVAENDLKVSDGNVAGDGTIYVLANKAKGVGFYKLETSDMVPAGKAYLKITGSSAPAFLGFGGDGNTTSISEMNVKGQADGTYYNLAGQRVAQPTKGLYIVNGKKYIVK